MRSITLIGLTVIALNAYSQAERKYIREGNGEYKDGNYQQAEVEYRKALEKDPQSYPADFNLGNALYKQKQYDAAASKYSALAGNEHNKQKLSRYYYNLGNSLFQKQKYSESIEAYKNALRNNPTDMDAKHNLQLALQMLNQQNQQQQQQDQQQNNGQPQHQKGQISPEDAERILQALENEEKEVIKKVQERKERVQKADVEKNW